MVHYSGKKACRWSSCIHEQNMISNCGLCIDQKIFITHVVLPKRFDMNFDTDGAPCIIIGKILYSNTVNKY